MDGQMDRQMDRHSDRCTNRQTYRWVDRWTHRKTDGQTDEWADSLPDGRLFTVPYFAVRLYMSIVEASITPNHSILYSPQFCPHQETKMMARQTQQLISTISQKNRRV